MPAAAPTTATQAQTHLAALGQHIRRHRRLQRISATSAAEAAGLSRVTLHRIEHGEASVTMGAYMNVIDALGLAVHLTGAADTPLATAKAASVPQRIILAAYPQLKQLAWQRQAGDVLTAQEALNLYERNWRHVDTAAMTAEEADLVRALAQQLGGGRLLV